MSALAIITARGGSKRIPRKNIRPFLGKPILLYSIEAALQAGIFDEVMVSTDDPEIAELAKGAGASVPFFEAPRPQTITPLPTTSSARYSNAIELPAGSLIRSAVSTPLRRLLPPKTLHCNGAFKGRRVRHASNDFSVSGSAQPRRR